MSERSSKAVTPVEPAEWLRDPALAPVWVAARERLERNGVVPQGKVTVGGLDRPTRHALSGLLGRPVLREAVRVDLSALDAELLRRSGVGGLVAVLGALGGPVRNRVAERTSMSASREAPYVAARSWLGEHPDAAAQAWVEQWLAGVRRSGVLTRSNDPARALVGALELADWLEARDDAAPVSRTSLAADRTGDAHALDDGAVLTQLVLRALAAAVGEPPPMTATRRRALWELYGVRPDTVSSTCLVLGLRPLGATGVARRLGLAAEGGDPVHVTAWDLARSSLAFPAGEAVFVCENPRVLEAIAQTCGGSVAVVCTAGMPGLVTVEVLRLLRQAGTSLAYHGDFDWPGIAIANRLMHGLGCQPWCMSAADYRASARRDGLPLVGAAVTPLWDAHLGEAMAQLGVALHEEAVLDTLLDALPAGLRAR